MTDTLTAEPALRTADRTVAFRRISGAVALPLAFAFQLACNTLYAVAATRTGGDEGTGEESLRFFAAHADAMLAATILALVGCLLAVPGVLAALRVLRVGRPALALSAAVLMIAGYVAYFGINMTNFYSLALAELAPDAGAAVDAVTANPAALPFFLLFVIGNLLGTLLLGLAVVMSPTLPWWSGVLIMCWTIGHVVNILGGGEWFAVAGGALEVAGLCVLTASALRTPDAVWAARG